MSDHSKTSLWPFFDRDQARWDRVYDLITRIYLLRLMIAWRG
jgi:hypothetical protein